MKQLLENWKRFVDEVETFDTIATSQEEIQKQLDYFYKEHAPSKGERKDLGEWKGNQLVSFELPEGDLFFVVDKEDIPIAYLSVAPFRESYAVGNVRKVKGGGFYATDLYEKVMEVLGKGSLYSDKAQTEDGKGIWARFQNKEKIDTSQEDGEGKWRWRLK
jgi:hypothetical protein